MTLGEYKLGFSWLGFLAFIIPMAPNILWAVLPPNENGITDMKAPYPWIDQVMQICRIMMIICLIFLVHQKGIIKSGLRPLSIVTIGCLAIYFIAWIFYFSGRISPLIILSLAVFPCMYFMGTAIILKNVPALIFSVIFAICHIGVTIEYIM